MTTVDKLMCEEFARRFGQTTPPSAESLGNYSCCDECRERCERLASTDITNPENGARAFENRMGTEAYEFIFPSLVYTALKNERDGFEVLARNLNHARYREFSRDQRDAMEFILDYCRSSGYGSSSNQARISETLNCLSELRENGCTPWESPESTSHVNETQN